MEYIFNRTMQKMTFFLKVKHIKTSGMSSTKM